MKTVFAAITGFWAALAAPFAMAQETGAPAPDAVPDTVPDPEPIIRPASEVTLAEFEWLKRPVVVFADNAADPRYVQQMQLITERLDVLAERDVVVITDTDPKAQSAVRRELRARGFMLVVLTKDGTIIFRSPAPRSEREISAAIDAVPLRRQEIRDRLNTLRE